LVAVADRGVLDVPPELGVPGQCRAVAALLGELHGTGSGVVADPPIGGGQLLVRVRDIAVVVALQQFEPLIGGKLGGANRK
jgi:hypothetical protein